MIKPCHDQDVWAIIRYFSPIDSICVLQYDKRADAEYQIEHLRRLNPGATYRLMTADNYRTRKPFLE